MGMPKLISELTAGTQPLYTDLVPIYQAAGTRRTTVEDLTNVVNVKQRGAVGDGVTDDTAAILAICNSFKIAGRLVAITDPTFGATNCYRAGTLFFPDGIYILDFDVFEFTELFGLTFQGCGSRKASDFQRGSTELVFTGSSSGYGFRSKGNGARNFCIKDMSITYQGNSFTGTLIDNWNSPGFHHENTYFGTDGITLATLYTTASAIVQMTGGEYYAPVHSWMSGGTYGIYLNTARSASSFGAKSLNLSQLTFYDFTEAHVATDGTYSVSGLTLNGTAFSPINIQPKRCLRLRNCNAVDVAATFNGATAAVQPSIEWVSMTNCQGRVAANLFGDRAPCGTFGGDLSIDSNYIYNTSGEGFRLWGGGAISGRSNNFADASKGWSVYPTLSISTCANNGAGLIRVTVTAHRLATGMTVTIAGIVGTTEANGNWTVTEISANTFDLQGSTFANAYISGGTLNSDESLAADLGPDTFNSAVTNSYALETETNSVQGRINYSRERDGSASKWSVAETSNGRVKLVNLDDRVVQSSSANVSISTYDTGRHYVSTNANPNAQTITLPSPTPGTRFIVTKGGTGDLTVQRQGSDSILSGTISAVSFAKTTTDVGLSITFYAWSTTVWLVESVVGSWTVA